MAQALDSRPGARRGGKSAEAFRTISEVAAELNVPQHVLRFWESKFSQIKPLKRGGGRRYYRPVDVDLLRGIRHLLYSRGYTIKGVQKILRESGAKAVIDFAITETTASETATEDKTLSVTATDGAGPGPDEKKRTEITHLIGELRAIQNLLQNAD
ncbi:MAG: MerR family transcriptional regulator [Sphingomonadales bacterium]